MNYVRITGGKNLPELREKIKRHALRYRVEQVLPDLPPLRATVLPLKLPKAAVELLKGNADYGKLAEAIEAFDSGGPVTPPAFLASIRRMLGIAKAPAVIAHARELLEIQGVNKLVIFAWHRDVLRAITEGLADLGAVMIDGSTPQSERQSHIDAFQTKARPRVIVGQITAMGTAVTLTAASDEIFAEASWTPEDNNQAAARCHRIGQRSAVLARFAYAVDTVDEALQRVLARKSATIGQVFD